MNIQRLKCDSHTAKAPSAEFFQISTKYNRSKLLKSVWRNISLVRVVRGHSDDGSLRGKNVMTQDLLFS